MAMIQLAAGSVARNECNDPHEPITGLREHQRMVDQRMSHRAGDTEQGMHQKQGWQFPRLRRFKLEDFASRPIGE